MNFSVLMSVYIKEKPEYLDSCLLSLQQQSLPADEIVIVLDGPITEELKTILTNWKKKLPINLIPLERNVGLGKALNAGLNHCTHEWIFRMDTDDIAIKTRFEQQIQFITQNPNTVLVGGQIKEFSKSLDDENKFRTVPLNSSDIIKFAKKRNPFNHMTVAYRKTVVLELNGYQHHLFMEDYNLWLRVLERHQQVTNLPTILVQARTGDAMLSRRKGKEYLKSEWQLYKLKNELKIHKPLEGFIIFIMRSIPRVFPACLLAILYKTQRTQKA